MPFVSLVTSVSLSEEKRELVRNAIFESIAVVPGKSAAVTMVEIRDGADIRKDVSDAPAIFIETRLFTRPPFEAKRAYYKALSEKLNALTGVEKPRIYFNVLEFNEWGSGDDYKSF